MLRIFDKSDKNHVLELNEMLNLEGVPSDETSYMDNPTFIQVNKDEKIVGFFTIGEEHKMASIRHFCVGRKYRGAESARSLIKNMIDILSEFGIKKFIAHGKGVNMHKIIEYYFKVKPYNVCLPYKYYIIEV